jgi:hypothetical protein
MKIADVICESETAQDNAITVWGTCGEKILDAGIETAYVIGASVTHWVGWETDNKGGTFGLTSLFGWIFGATGQVGGNVAKGTSGPVDKITLIIEGFAVPNSK